MRVYFVVVGKANIQFKIHDKVYLVVFSRNIHGYYITALYYCSQILRICVECKDKYLLRRYMLEPT